MNLLKKMTILAFLSVSAHAVTGGFIELTPLVSLDTVNKTYPYNHSSQRTAIGLRANVGLDILHAEAQITRSSASKSFSSGESYKDSITTGRVGIGSNIGVFPLKFAMRGGMQGRKISEDRTQSGVTVNNVPAVYMSPYLGAGVIVDLVMFKVDLAYTSIFTGKPNSTSTEHDITLGLTFGL